MPGRPGQGPADGSEEEAVAGTPAGSTDLPLEDSELVTEGEDLSAEPRVWAATDDEDLEQESDDGVDEGEEHEREDRRGRLGDARRAVLGSPTKLTQAGLTAHGLSPKSVWNVHLCLTRAVKDAVKDGLRQDNPARGAVKPPKEKPVIDFWTSVEYAVFLHWVDGRTDPHDQAFYRLAVQTGMRRGELLGLRWSEIDWEARTVTVVQQLAQRREGTGRFGPPKTRASNRTIDLSDDTLEAQRVWREAQDEQRRAWEELYQDRDLVFCRENGDSHDPRAISKRFCTQAATAGIKRIRFHDLRHSSAVIGLREPGEWVDEVSKRLGHESTAFTLDTYGHLLPQRGREVATAFDRLVQKRRAA